MEIENLCIDCGHIKTYVCGCPEIKGLYCSNAAGSRFQKTIFRNDKPDGCPYFKKKREAIQERIEARPRRTNDV